MKSLSRITLYLIFILNFLAFLYLQSYKKLGKEGDSWGYYVYLPATFIYHDLPNLQQSHLARGKYVNIDAFKSPQEGRWLEETLPSDNGNYVIKWTMGIAIMISPFFFIAHFLAGVLGYPQDGYHEFYYFWVFLGIILYQLLGLMILRKIFLRYFSELTVSVSLFLLALGTNLFFFAVNVPLMSHVPLFFLYSLLIYSTIHWYESGSIRWALLIGFLSGFITMTRPNDLIAIMIPVLWGIQAPFAESFVSKWNWIKSHFVQILCAIAFLIVGLMPQLLYWKIISGHWFFYSYGSETFDFKHPHLYECLVGYKNGWITYTPLVILMIIGVGIKSWKRPWFMPTVTMIPLQFFIISSWWCWWWTCGVGLRPMVETYALFAFSLILFVDYALRQSLFLKTMFGLIAAVFTLQNLMLSYQHYLGVVLPETQNKAFYWNAIGKTRHTLNDLYLFDTELHQPAHPEKFRQISTLYKEDFEIQRDSSWTLDSVNAFNGKYAFVQRQKGFCPGYKTTCGEHGIKPGDWIRMKGNFRVSQGHIDIYRCIKWVFTRNHKGQALDWRGAMVENKLNNPTYSFWGDNPYIWGEMTYWYQMPANTHPEDDLHIYVWNDSGHILWMDAVTIDLFREP